MKTITDYVKISLLMLVVLVAMSIGVSAQAPPPPLVPPPPVPTAPFILTATPTIVISGIPTDVTFTVVYNSTPFSGATVTLSESAASTGITDANGTVTIRVKAAGVDEITATVTKDGYLSTEYPAFLTVIHTPPEYIELILRDIVLILAIVLTPSPNQWLAAILTTYLLVWKFLPRIHVKFDDYFIIASVPYIIFGSLLRVLENTGTIEPPIRYLFITPIVYAVTLSIAILLLLLTKAIAPKLNIPDWRVLFGSMGIILSMSSFALLFSVRDMVHPEIFLWILGLGTVLSLIIYGIGRFFDIPLVTNWLNALIIWAHLLNTLSIYIWLDSIFHNATIFHKEYKWTYFVLPLLWILDAKFRNQDSLRNILKLSLLFIGLTFATRNTLRLVFGI